MQELISVRFLRGCGPYLAGELAGFPRELAIKYARSGAAVLVNPPAGYAEDGLAQSEGFIEGFAMSELDVNAGLEPKHAGGGMYAVAGVKVKGKAKAQAIADALGALGDTPGSGDSDD